MLERGIGAILNVGSLAGMAPAPGFALYAASKAFLHDMTIALREELRDTGVTVSPARCACRAKSLRVAQSALPTAASSEELVPTSPAATTAASRNASAIA